MAEAALATTPEPPYYAVIFTSQREGADRGYEAMADRMSELASQQGGFLGVESARSPEGFGITISYWESLESIRAWRENVEHQAAQDAGRKIWYSRYRVRISQVLRAYDRPEEV